MLDLVFMKAFAVSLVVVLLAILIKYARLSRMRKPGTEMPSPSRSLALATGVFDRVFLLFSLGFASLLFLGVYPNVFLTFSCPFDLPLQLTGMALFVAGMFGAWWAIASLGEFNQPRWARLKQGHRVIKTGAYRYIRHPLYVSKMLAYLGLFLFFENFLFLLIFLSSVLLLYLQARSEEELLTEVFRGEYRSYQAATGMFLPRVLSQWIRQVRVAMLWK